MYTIRNQRKSVLSNVRKTNGVVVKIINAMNVFGPVQNV